MTILHALQAKVTYPLTAAFFETVLIERGLTGTDTYTFEVSSSRSFLLAVADCMKAVATGVNLSEGEVSVSIPERDKLIALANSTYSKFGEPVIDDGQPKIKFLEDW